MDDMNDLKEQLQNENLAIVGSQEFEDNQLSEKEAIEYFQGQQDDLQDNQDELKNQNRLLEQQEFIKLDNDLVDKEIENQTRDDQSQTQPFVKDFIMENSQIKDHLQTNDQINNGQLNKDSQLNDEPQQNQELQLYEEQQQTYEQQQNEQQQQNEELYQNEDIINNQNIQQNENTQQFDDQQSNIETQNLNSYQNERQQFNHGQYQLQDSKIQQQNKDTQLMCDQQEIVQINQHENENNKNEEIINQLDLNEIYEEDQHSIEKQMKGSQFTNQLTQNEDNLREINDNFDQELRNSTIKDESQRDIGQLDMSSIVQDDQKKDDDCQIYLEIQKKNNKDSIMDNVMQNVVNKTSKQVQGLIKILNDDPHNLRQRKNNNSRIIMDTSVNQEDQLKLKEAMKEKQLLESRLKQLDKKIESLCVNQFVQMEENIEKEQPRVQTQLIDPKDLVKKYNKQRREMEKKREIERMEFLQLIEKNDIQTKQQEEVKLKIESEEKKIRVLKRMEEHNQKKELFKLQQKSSQDLLRKIHMNRPKKNLNDIVRQRSNEVLQRQPPIYMDKKTLNQFAKEHDELVKQKGYLI